jgi:hypothetical protein
MAKLAEAQNLVGSLQQELKTNQRIVVELEAIAPAEAEESQEAGWDYHEGSAWDREWSSQSPWKPAGGYGRSPEVRGTAVEETSRQEGPGVLRRALAGGPGQVSFQDSRGATSGGGRCLRRRVQRSHRTAPA